MIKELEHLDERTAVGILARAALALEDEGNPDAQVLLEGEDHLRAILLREARDHLGISQDDDRPETIEKLSEFLDQESDRLTGLPDTDTVLKRLAERGELPSDLYEIKIIPNIVDFHSAGFVLEKRLIEATIRAPTHEQHFGPEHHGEDPALISLFARHFKTRFPYKDFTMLVAGQRDGLVLHVHQAWRIYPSLLGIHKVATLVDLLRCFADKYGYDVEIDGRRGHFFLLLDKVAPTHVRVKLTQGKGRLITLSQFLQKDRRTGRQYSALVVAIDLAQYRAILRQMKVKLSDMVDFP